MPSSRPPAACRCAAAGRTSGSRSGTPPPSRRRARARRRCAPAPAERPSTYAQRPRRRPPTNAASGTRSHACRAVPVGDRERRAEPGAGGDAEQVRVGERVAEDALVRRAGDREHPADERARARRAARGAARGSPIVDAARAASGRAGTARARAPTSTIAAGPMPTGADAEPDEQRAEQERRRAQRATSARRRGRGMPRGVAHARDAACAITTASRPPRRRARSRRCAAPSARRRVVDARPRARAAPPRSPLQPGRAATVAGVCPQQTRVGEHDQVGVRRDDVLGRELRVAGAATCRPRRRCS